MWTLPCFSSYLVVATSLRGVLAPILIVRSEPSGLDGKNLITIGAARPIGPRLICFRRYRKTGTMAGCTY